MRYLIRHDTGECVEIESKTRARLQALLKAECADRGWLIADTELIEMADDPAQNKSMQRKIISLQGDWSEQ